MSTLSAVNWVIQCFVQFIYFKLLLIYATFIFYESEKAKCIHKTGFNYLEIFIIEIYMLVMFSIKSKGLIKKL